MLNLSNDVIDYIFQFLSKNYIKKMNLLNRKINFICVNHVRKFYNVHVFINNIFELNSLSNINQNKIYISTGYRNHCTHIHFNLYITHITFVDDFNENINNVIFLTHLTFGKYFNQNIDNVYFSYSFKFWLLL